MRTKTHYLFLFFLFLATISNAQITSHYYTDLKNVVKDELNIELAIEGKLKDTILFCFPRTIPGTYQLIDYGRFIHNLKAIDTEAKELKIKKIDINSFQIIGTKKLKKIIYQAEASFDKKLKKNKVFKPEGTNIEADKNFVINAGGFFGYIKNYELEPIELTFKKSNKLYGVTVLKENKLNDSIQSFSVKNYHQLIDCPILFAEPDTASIQIKNTKIKIAVYGKPGEKISQAIQKEISQQIKAIDHFLPALPVQEYAFLIYVDDYRYIGRELIKENTSAVKKLKLIRKVPKEVGALEHGNSSFYYLVDLGLKSVTIDKQLNETAIHEFMHIITPLALRSNLVAHFDYTNPMMSKHLWLYEGVTEYFAGIIELQDTLISFNQYLQKIRNKIRKGEKFPYQKMSLTEMSANSMEPIYHKEYIHIYDRGAVLGLLLDLEIIKLTKGKLNLKEGILLFQNKYNMDHPFNEDTFIDEFIKEVHPDLKNFFANYIEGKNDWNIQQSLDIIGIEYEKEKKILKPKDPIINNDVKIPFVKIGTIPIKKVGKKEWAGLKKEDKVSFNYYRKTFLDENGDYKKEGDTVQLEVIRKNENIKLPIRIEYIQGIEKNYIKNITNKTPEQEMYFNKWIGK